MTEPASARMSHGGQIQGIVGAGSVVIENLTFYSRAPDELRKPRPPARADRALPLSGAGVFRAG